MSIRLMNFDQTKKNLSINIWFIAYLILLIIVITAGCFITGYLGDKARQEILEYNDKITSLHSSHLTAEFDKIDRAVRIMSGANWIVSALISRAEQDIANANSVLDRYNSGLGSSVCYLMDNNGITIASSNRNNPDSFVGKSYKFRPYFMQAIKGSAGRYFALGATSLKRGFYSSYSVRESKGKIIGVAVIKQDVDDEEAHLTKYPNCFIIDPNGIIFLSGRQEMNFKSLWPVSSETKLALIESKQFGKREFEALLPGEISDGTVITFEGKKHLASRKIINPEGWSILVMTTTERVLIYRVTGVIFIILICAFIIVPFIINFKISRLAEKVSESEIRFRMLFQNLTVGFALHEIILNDEGQPCNYRFLEVNPAFEQLTGLKAQDLIGRTVFEVLPSTELFWIENYGNVATTGNPLRFENYSHEFGRFYECLAYSPRRGQFAVLFTDITERRKMEDEIHVLSVTDQLTGLNNRRGFLSLAGQQFRLSDRNKGRMLLFFADIDWLKRINDIYGHEEGDRAIIETANVLRETFRASDIIARLGGDEFGILAIDIKEESPEIFTARLQQLVDKQNDKEGRIYKLSISIGCSYYDPEKPCYIDELMARADKLMYEQKQKKICAE